MATTMVTTTLVVATLVAVTIVATTLAVATLMTSTTMATIENNFLLGIIRTCHQKPFYVKFKFSSS